jgi:acetolactate synthase-1/2/3 large subunit
MRVGIWFSNFGNSSMGYALPSAIGAAIGSDVPVICIDGDGGFQMNIQELQTIKHYNIPLKIFILNNNCYGIIKQFQDAYFDSRYIATTGKDYSAPDFSEVARAYGIPTLVATKENYKDIFDTVLHSSGPVLVNVMIDPEQKLIPKLEFGNALDDMYPYLSDDEFNSYMFKKKERKNNTNKTWVTLK